MFILLLILCHGPSVWPPALPLSYLYLDSSFETPIKELDFSYSLYKKHMTIFLNLGGFFSKNLSKSEALSTIS
jgi:hypothetical protein